MAKIIDLPKLSPTMEEGTLVRWAKKEGDKVDIDDLLAEVETDKATMEFRAFDRGTLLKRLIEEGATAKLGQPVAIFGEPGEDVSALVPSASAPAVAPKAAEAPPPATTAAPPTPSAAPAVPLAPAAPAPSAEPAASPPPVARVPSGPALPAIAGRSGMAGLVLLPQPRDAGDTGTSTGRASPRVRRLARERGIDLVSVRATGPRGRITPGDLDAAPGRTTNALALRGESRTSLPDTVKPASQMRKAIARNISAAKRDVPHFYLEADLDVEAMLAMREQLNQDVEKDARVSVNDLFIRAAALALGEVPASNASWSDGNVIYHHRADISLAVAIEDGLLTPVLRDADVKSIRAIAAEARELAERARAKKLKPEEMQGGVMSVSNLGMFGIDRFSAVINPPEGMILAVGSARDVPVVRGGALVAGKRCAVTLSCDHRVVDGALGAQYLRALRGFIERPVRILA